MICKNQVVGRTKDGLYYVHPCGQCLNCRINDSRAWYVRTRFEIKKPERPFLYFLTLTFSDEFLPQDGLCTKSELKKFLNNLNTSFNLHMRYYSCSDYGSEHHRPHYHALICSSKKITPEQCRRIWKKGFIYLKVMKPWNIKYVVRYTVKKQAVNYDEKAYFRLISKGWGNNVKDFYTGQEYFIFDGKKFGISPYLRDKLGLKKKEVDKTKYYDRLVLSPSFQNVGHWEDYERDVLELNLYRRKLK